VCGMNTNRHGALDLGAYFTLGVGRLVVLDRLRSGGEERARWIEQAGHRITGGQHCPSDMSSIRW